jgi:ATP-dependent DNA helicase RecQ
MNATATPRVAGDVLIRLGLSDPTRIMAAFDRPNLSHLPVHSSNDGDREQRIVAVLADPAARVAIVSRVLVLAARTSPPRSSRRLHPHAAVYPAGREREHRTEAQRCSMADDVEIVVATHAFSMGIDKLDVRTVCHAAVPGSFEAFIG